MEIYSKAIYIRLYKTDRTLHHDFGKSFINVPKVDKTSSELYTAWDAINRQASPEDIIAGMRSYIPGVAMPFLNEGASPHNLHSGAYWDTFAAFNAGSEFSYTYTSSMANFFAYTNENGVGMYSCPFSTGYGPAYVDGPANANWHSIYGTFDAPFGIYGISSTPPKDNLCFFIISSDNIVHCYVLYLNRNNSRHAAFSVQTSQLIIDWLETLPDYVYDPYEPVEPPDTPPGEFDDDDQPITPPDLPSISTADLGFYRIYNPTLGQLQSLARYLWTDTTFLSTAWNHIKQIFANPMDVIIALNMLPVQIPSSRQEEFSICYFGTGQNLSVADKQFIAVDCGSARIKNHYGSALDYSPYTKLNLFLPFIGSVELDVDECMGKTLSLKYHVDIVSGACTAIIMLDGSQYYQFSGNCAINLPITAADFSQYMNAILSGAKAMASFAAAGAGAPELSAFLAGVRSPEQKTSITHEVYSSEDAAAGILTTGSIDTSTTHATGASFSSLAAANVVNTVSGVMGAKPVIERAGGFSGNSGFIGQLRPYITKTIPRIANPEKYGAFNGRPCMKYLSLGACTGYTQVQQIRLSGMTATNPEQDEILSFLKAGVVL